VLKNTAVTNNGLITIEAGNQATGDLNVRGPVNAGNNDVVLINQRGNITGAGLITGRNLEIQVSGGSADVATNVDGLTATVATAGETLTVQESDGLTILAGNVTTNDGDVSLTVSAGDLIGDGSINAGTGNVTLSVPAGEVIINPGAEIIANVLDVDAAGGATLRTNVDNLSVDLTAVGAALTVSEADDIGILGIETNNGDVSITAAGSINGTGGIDAGTGDILLDAGNGINIAGAVVGDDLDVTAGNNAELSTNVNTLHGTVGGNLNVSETDGLVIPAAGITAGNLTLDLAAGDLSGTGDLEISESVNLFARDGSVTFNSRSGQVEGTDLNVSAATSANVRTDVDSVVSNQTGSLTIEEVNGLDIGAAGIDTSAGNGAVSITLLRGDLTGNGIDAGEGNITIDARRGAVDLSAGTVAGNALELTAYRGPVVLNTDLDRINALVTRNGDLTITEADDLIVDRARVNRGGSVSINITGTGNLTIAGDVQATGRTGDVVLETNNGDVTLGPDGTISTRATLDLTGVNGSIVVEPGTNSRRITTGRRATDVQMNPGQYVDWQLDASDTTQASIRTVIDNINRFSGNSVIDVQEATSIELTRSLPAFRNSVTIKGNDNLTLSGSNDGNNRLSGFTFRADGSSVSNVTLNDFGRTAVTLIGGRSSGDAVDMQVSNVTINNSQTGLRAVNYFGAAATFENNTIDAQSRVRSFGVLLAKARGFTVDNNTISGTHIGIQISSRSEGTTVSNNTISGRDPNNGYGISLLRATGLLGDILDVDGNKIDDFQFGIFASGFCTYSTVQNTDFTAITGSPISLANQYNVSRSRNLTVIV
jgi:parallel beta-helix repeat protein